MRSFLKYFPLELVVWTVGLIGLAIINPANAHLSICPLHNMGFDFCPGCGLGRSISFFLHGRVGESLQVHPLGIFALIVLSLRILQLIKNYPKIYGKNY